VGVTSIGTGEDEGPPGRSPRPETGVELGGALAGGEGGEEGVRERALSTVPPPLGTRGVVGLGMLRALVLVPERALGGPPSSSRDNSETERGEKGGAVKGGGSDLVSSVASGGDAREEEGRWPGRDSGPKAGVRLESGGLG
jgi:hypothetical protein